MRHKHRKQSKQQQYNSHHHDRLHKINHKWLQALHLRQLRQQKVLLKLKWFKTKTCRGMIAEKCKITQPQVNLPNNKSCKIDQFNRLIHKLLLQLQQLLLKLCSKKKCHRVMLKDKNNYKHNKLNSKPKDNGNLKKKNYENFNWSKSKKRPSKLLQQRRQLLNNK